MNIVGIIAEYNPFHNGHQYQIEYARNVLQADQVIVAMSGCFTQRGTPALLDPWTRARMALLNGADLVLLIPAIGSCASSREYARAGAALLNATGIVDTLLFGAEDPDQELFQAAADSRPAENDPLLKEHLVKGESFATARAAVMEQRMLEPAPQQNEKSRERVHAFLASPNNILGIEYTAAIQDLKLPLKPVPMQRNISSHSSIKISNAHAASDRNYASSGAIRNCIAQYATQSVDPASTNNQDLSKKQQSLHGKAEKEAEFEKAFQAMPENTSEILQSSLRRNEFILPDDFGLLYISSLLEHMEYTQYFDCNEDFSRRIRTSLDSFTSISDFCAHTLKSKNMTLSRVWRIMTHILLGITDDLMGEYKSVSCAPYLYVAGVRKESRNLLSEISQKGSAPLITSPTGLNDANNILSCGLHAEALYRMVLNNKSQIAHPTPYTRRLQII